MYVIKCHLNVSSGQQTKNSNQVASITLINSITTTLQNSRLWTCSYGMLYAVHVERETEREKGVGGQSSIVEKWQTLKIFPLELNHQIMLKF